MCDSAVCATTHYKQAFRFAMIEWRHGADAGHVAFLSTNSVQVLRYLSAHTNRGNLRLALLPRQENRGKWKLQQ